MIGSTCDLSVEAASGLKCFGTKGHYYYIHIGPSGLFWERRLGARRVGGRRACQLSAARCAAPFFGGCSGAQAAASQLFSSQQFVVRLRIWLHKICSPRICIRYRCSLWCMRSAAVLQSDRYC
jgi:hypothetical protein